MNIKQHCKRYAKPVTQADLGQLVLTYCPPSAKHRRNFGPRFTTGLFFGFPVWHPLPTVARLPISDYTGANNYSFNRRSNSASRRSPAAVELGQGSKPASVLLVPGVCPACRGAGHVWGFGCDCQQGQGGN